MYTASQFAPPGDVTLIMLTSRIHDFSMMEYDLTHNDISVISVTSLLSLADVRDGHVMGHVTSCASIG